MHDRQAGPILFLVAGIIGCSHAEPSVGRPPTRTEVGAPTGAAVSTVIGPGGGSITSGDGLMSVDIPAGALTSDQTITIQPLTAKAPGGLGPGYRLGPERIQFTRPVAVSFQMAEQHGPPSTIGRTGIAYQDSTGAWVSLDVTRDEASGTVSASTTHFSDWSFVEGLQIRPPDTTVKRDGKVRLVVNYCSEFSRNDQTWYQTLCAPPPADPPTVDGEDELPQLPRVDGNTWAVNARTGGDQRVGRVASAARDEALYTAPSSTPDPNVVAVSVSYTRGREKSLLVANITIEAFCAPGASPLAAARARAADDCRGSWSGTSRIELADSYTMDAQVTWVLDTLVGNSATYHPVGKVKFTPPDECTSVSPSEMQISEDNTQASLQVFFFPDSVTYVGIGGTIWSADLVDTCEPDEPQKGIVGGGWFNGGGTSPNLRLISGSVSVSGVTATYNFTR